MKFWTTKFAMAAFALPAAMAMTDPAAAQATRTWVSGVGDDANPCSRTAPCRSFAGTISKTAAGGEINCLDSGSFGAVTITKAIKILCDTSQSAVSVSGTNGININAGPDDMIVLSGLHIAGLSNGTSGSGIRFFDGGGVHIRNAQITGFDSGASYAVNFTPTSSNATLTLDNVTFAANGSGNNTGGVLIRPANGRTATFAIENAKFNDNGGTAVRVDLNGTTGTSVKGTVTNSVFAHSGTAVFVRAPAGVTTAEVLALNNVITGGQNGLTAQDSGATLNASGNSITLNSAFGVRAGGGAALVSYGDNELVNNGNNGVFTATVTKQ